MALSSFFFISLQTKFVNKFFYSDLCINFGFFWFLFFLVSNFSVYAILHVISYAEFLKYTMYVNKYTASTVYGMCMDFILFCSEITFPYTFNLFFCVTIVLFFLYNLAFTHAKSADFCTIQKQYYD